MKLRSFTIALLFIMAITAMVAQFVISRSIVGGGFQELEMEQARAGIQRTKKTVLNELKVLDVFLWDWTSWDDTYQFVQDGNDEYAESNLVPDTFIDQSLTSMIFRDKDGNVVFAQSYDDEGELLPKTTASLLEALESIELPPIPGEDSGDGGLLMLPQGAFLVAERTVLTSAGEGPPMGTMLMTKKLGQEMVDELSDTLESSLSLTHLPLAKDTAEDEALEAFEALHTGEEFVVIMTDDETAHSYAILQDVHGEPALLLQEEMGRSIHKHGLSVSLYNFAFLVLVIIAYSVVVYILLQKRVLSRIFSLRRQVSSLSNSTGRVHVSGADEIAQLKDSVNAMLQNIEETHREVEERNREIAESERFLNQLFNSIKAGIMLVDPETKTVVEINEFALEMSGFSREEVEGHLCHKVLCPTEADHCPFIDMGQVFDYSARRLVARDGSIIPIMKSVCYIQKDERTLLLETFVDISEMEKAKQDLESARDELESKVAERTRELEKANVELVALNKAKTLFLSSASHELRTPLTSILGFLKLMEKSYWQHFLPHLEKVPELDVKTRRFGENFAVTRNEAERLGRLVNDLLDLNKIESGRMVWRDELLLPSEVLANATAALASLVENKDIDMKLVVPQDLPQVMADSDRIHQVIINLLQNAVKFTNKGVITASARRVEGGVEFSISDTGVGIPIEDHEQIFDIFYQAQSGDRRSAGPFGTGLGLAICTNILAHYGSRMKVESVVGEGSRFSFTLPEA